MNIWIALFRGINVGGNNMLPMKALTALIEGLGGTQVKTYIQSGNAVFGGGGPDAVILSKRIEAAVLNNHGFSPRVMLLTRKELERAAIANPFREAEAEPKTLHIAFLAEAPTQPDLAGMDALKREGEAYALDGKVFYLHTPGGLGQSKLAERYEKLLGVPATARNWNTVMKLRELAKEA
ncbi:MAG: DUF1697 domain-containing protein [Betaproteobacteria bacterium]|nr:DUF1697 domain-containing protein [Betaproteobacteria bacterium]